MNKKILGAVVVLLILVGGAFYGGMVYAKSAVSGGRNGNFAGQFGPGGMGANRTGSRMGGFTAGQILSKDAMSMTIKMQDGSTKIVLVSSSTPVMKTVTGSVNDLATGTDVVVTGSANSDGSITAQSVQIRPAGPMPTGAPAPTTR